MDREYYILWYRLDGIDSYLIWYSDERDGVFVDASGVIPSFRDVDRLLSYAEKRGISVNSEKPILHNLDVLEEWLRAKDAEKIECNSFNSAWNLFADISRSINGSFDRSQKMTQKIYNKLFWGCNLPSVTPEGEQYHPAWTRRGLEIMHDVLGSGLRMFQSSVRSL